MVAQSVCGNAAVTTTFDFGFTAAIISAICSRLRTSRGKQRPSRGRRSPQVSLGNLPACDQRLPKGPPRQEIRCHQTKPVEDQG